MKMNGEGIYVGKKEFYSEKSKKTYVDLKILDEEGDTLKFSVPEGTLIPALQQMDKVKIVSNIVQGQYPRYIIISIVAIKTLSDVPKIS